MLHDNALFENASDIVAENVTALPADPKVNAMVYLTVADGAFQPGLYIFSEVRTWTFLSNSAPIVVA